MDTTPDVIATTQAEKAREVYSRFLLRQAYYSTRNARLVLRNEGFEGNHWPAENTASLTEKQKEKLKEKFKLVFNYTRRVVLGYVAALARQPKPRVPAPKDDAEAAKANRREKLLMLVWEDLMEVWYDVELNAAKLGYGILQAVWAPDADQPKEVNVGVGENTVMKKHFTKDPFVFRSIPPDLFYPVFKTFNRADDYYEIFRHDPGRLVADLEEQYSVQLQGTGTTNSMGWREVETEPTCDVIEHWTTKRYLLIACTQKKYSNGAGRSSKYSTEPAYAVLADKPNPYKGKFPFWLVQNMRNDPLEDPTNLGSISDIDDILSLNKHLDLVISESAEEVITNIHRPLVYKTDEPSQDPAALVFAAGAVYPIGAEEELEPLKYQNDPAGVKDHIAQIFKGFEDLTFMGSAGFGDMENSASGIAARVALTPMQQVLELKLPQRIRALRRTGSFILEVMETMLRQAGEDVAFSGWIQDSYQRFEQITLNPDDIKGAYYTDVSYGNLLPRDEYAYQQNEVYKWKTGAQSLITTLDALGNDDAQAEFDRLKKELQDPVLNPEKVRMQKELEMMGQQPPMPQGGGGAVPPGQPGQQPQQGAQVGGQQQMNPQMMQMLQAMGGGGANPMMGAGNQQMGNQGGVQSLPGSAQPGTMPVSQQMPPGSAMSQMQTAPQVPGPATRQEGQGAGKVAPFIRRRGK